MLTARTKNYVISKKNQWGSKKLRIKGYTHIDWLQRWIHCSKCGAMWCFDFFAHLVPTNSIGYEDELVYNCHTKKWMYPQMHTQTQRKHAQALKICCIMKDTCIRGSNVPQAERTCVQKTDTSDEQFPRRQTAPASYSRPILVSLVTFIKYACNNNKN